VTRGPQCSLVSFPPPPPHNTRLSMAFFEGAGLCGNTAESHNYLEGGGAASLTGSCPSLPLRVPAGQVPLVTPAPHRPFEPVTVTLPMETFCSTRATILSFPGRPGYVPIELIAFSELWRPSEMFM
jgi:hypothetical protein